MSPRDRMLGLIAIPTIFVFAGGFLGYQFYLQPMKTTGSRILTLTEELDKDETQLREIEAALPRLRLMKRLSLPADPVLASREYGEELDRMLRASDFPAGKYGYARKEAESRAPTSPTKKPPFQKLVYDVNASGELASLVAFLERFYQTPLLHRVRTLRVDRPITATSQQRQNELNISLTIEALIVDGAENRKTLLPKDVTPPKVLARETAQYASIAGRDIFFGPPPPSQERDRPPPRTEVELADCVHLDGITHGEKESSASLYDVLNNRRYQIRVAKDGSVRVDTYYYIKDRKKPLDVAAKELAILDETGDKVVMTYAIARIDATNLILESEGTFFILHVGDRISDVKELKAAEAKDLGLPVKDKKAAAKDNKGVRNDDKKADATTEKDGEDEKK